MEGQGTVKPLEVSGYFQHELKSTAIPFELMEGIREVLAHLDEDSLISATMVELQRYFGSQTVTLTERGKDDVFRVIAQRGMPEETSDRVGWSVPEDSLSNAVAMSRSPMVRISNDEESPLTFWFLLPSFMGVPIIDEQGEVEGAIVLGWDHDIEADSVARDLELFASAFSEAWSNARNFNEAFIMGRKIEQYRIAQELHDSIAQGLFSIELYILDLLGDDSLSDSAKEQLGKIASVIKTQKIDLRSVIYALKTRSDETQGSLKEILDFEVKQHLDRGGVPVEKNVFEAREEISEEMFQVFRLLVREALANVRKHAHASQVLVSVGTQRGNLLVAVQDDGVGLTLEESSEEHGAELCFGLDNLRALMADYGGSVSLDQNERGSGCVLWARIPLEGGKKDGRITQ